MTIAYWCILAVIFLPYILVFMSRVPTITLENNLIPRLSAEELTGIQQRLYWAHLNALEAIAPFAAVVIIAHNLQMDPPLLNTLALSFVGLRIAHAIAYSANLGVIRSLIFIATQATMVTIFIKSAA